MSNKEPVGAHGIRELIAAIAAKNASGRLDVVAGATEGALLFKHGKLVDARIGHLTGFQAINAVASMSDARFHFDSSAVVPTSSSITSRERLVLKQFFGIETFDSRQQPAPAILDEVEEAAVVTSNLSSAPTETAAVYQNGSNFRYLTAFALGVLVIALAAAAVLLRNEFRERSSPVATTAASTPVEHAPVEAASSRPVLTATKANENTTPVAAPASNATAPASKPTVRTPDLSGEWNVVNTIQKTSYRSFQNLRVGFALSINQTGTTFTAKGQKVSENGRSLPANSRTPIEVKGSINGDRIEATFSERGAARKTNGRFVWKIDRAGGGLTGVFASTAARTSGTSTATREL